MRRFTGGLLVATLAAGSLLASAPASAISLTSKTESISAHPSTTVKPPVLSKAWYRCSDDGAVVAVSLRNPNQIELSYQLQISAGDVQEAQAVTLTPQADEVLEFHGIPNGRYVILVLNDVGDRVAHTRGRVKCPATDTCQATALPTLGNHRTEVTGGDPSGRYLVGSAITFETDYVYSAVVWERGQLRLLDTEPLQPYSELRPLGVNRHGTIIGYRQGAPTVLQDPWLYRDGKFTILPELTPADDSGAEAINSRGDVIGNSQQGLLWPANRPGTVRALTVPGQSDRAYALDIDEDGTILGILGGIPGGTPYIWPPHGAPYPLNVPPGINIEDTNVSAIRNGWVAGYGQEGNHLVGLRWNLRRHTVEKTSTDYPLSLTVNRHGTIGAVGAVIHRDRRAVPLGEGDRPLVVTDRGTAAGNTWFGQPVIWTGC